HLSSCSRPLKNACEVRNLTTYSQTKLQRSSLVFEPNSHCQKLPTACVPSTYTDVTLVTKAGVDTPPRTPDQENSTRAPDKENLMPVQPRDLKPSEEYTGSRPTPAPPPETWRDKAPRSVTRPSLGPSPAPSRGP
ncbi:hypothetical protein LINPERPRIM_LOCUS630, partial [Linum perenne]